MSQPTQNPSKSHRASLPELTGLPQRFSPIYATRKARPTSIYNRPIFPTAIGAKHISNTTVSSASSSAPSNQTGSLSTLDVNLVAFEFLFAEIVRYTQQRVDGIGEFEKKLSELGQIYLDSGTVFGIKKPMKSIWSNETHWHIMLTLGLDLANVCTIRLNILGYQVGSRLLSLLTLRDGLSGSPNAISLSSGKGGNLGSGAISSASSAVPIRLIRLLPVLSWVHSTVWKTVVGKTADILEHSNENDDEYMISDNDLLLTRAITIPKEMSQLSCGAYMAGIVEGALDGLGFPARVTSHSAPSPQFPRRTTLLIKFEKSCMDREKSLSAS